MRLLAIGLCNWSKTVVRLGLVSLGGYLKIITQCIAFQGHTHSQHHAFQYFLIGHRWNVLNQRYQSYMTKIRGEKNLQKIGDCLFLHHIADNSAPSQCVGLSFTTIGMLALNWSSLFWKFRLANKGCRLPLGRPFGYRLGKIKIRWLPCSFFWILHVNSCYSA